MKESPLIAADTRFAFKLFAALARQEQGRNVFISPTSVALALLMAYNGARGETQRAMAAALELGGMSLDEINRACADLMQALEQLDPQVRLAIANSLWGRKGISFQPDFVERNEQFYRAEIAELDFADPRAPATINDWVRRNTNGRIERIVDQIDGATVLFLIDAIYFKGDWARRFDKRLTDDGAFTLLDGRRKQHPLMRQSGMYSYYEGGGFQAISLPYGAGRLCMDIFLSASDSNLEAFQRQLNPKSWDSWLPQFRQSEGMVALPRFKLEYEATLNDALASIGMAVAFDPRRADFSGMCQSPIPRLSIDQVKHKTFVEVNEEGTEAAAVTSVGIRLTSFVPKHTFTMIVDRPFFFAIRDTHTGAILFMGSIVDP
jgi:serine protease inhibitor